MEELTSSAYLKYDVNVGFIVKVSIHLNNVGMIEIELNLKLSNKLFSNFLLLY